MLLRVLDEYAAAHPEAGRVGIGDLSRPDGGVFDERFGGRGHASHQNGLDVDVYYPRLDGQELRAARPAQVQRALSQDLVTRFVRAGAVKVFVGLRVGLRGPRRKVEPLIYHDDHMHVRIGPDPSGGCESAYPSGAAAITAVRAGDTGSPTRALVVGCIHGNECAGTAVTRILGPLVPGGRPLGRLAAQSGRLRARPAPERARRRPEPQLPVRVESGRPALGWRVPRAAPTFRAGDAGGRPAHPANQASVTIWFHQPQALVRAWGPSSPRHAAMHACRGCGSGAIRWPRGTAPNWQNHRFPGTSSFVVELPAGPLTPAAANRHARAVLALLGSST